MGASANRMDEALAALPPLKLFIGNEWVTGHGQEQIEVRNPATGETIEIAASRKLGFSPAKQVKDALAD